MLKRQRVLFHWSLVVMDLCIVATTCWIGRHWVPGEGLSSDAFRLVHDGSSQDLAEIAIVLIAWALLAPRFDLYRSRRTESPLREIWALVQTWVVSFALASLVTWYGSNAPHVMPPQVLALTPLVLIVMRVPLRLALRAVRAKGRNYRQTLIVGESGPGRDVARTLQDNPQFGIRVVGNVAFAEGEPTDVGPAPALGRVAELQSILAANEVDSVVVCPPVSATGRDVERVFRVCDEAGIPCHLAPAFLDLAHLRPTVTRFGNLPLLSFEAVRGGLASLAVKRAVDLVLAAGAIVLFGPAMACIAFLIRLQDGGPVFFSQVRVGRHGRKFRLYKFRTMTVDAEACRQQLVGRNEVDGPVFKIQQDPRVTAIGRALRKYSLDELPQLLNVLRGEMSLVGPRPPIPSEVDQYVWWQRRRLSVKPGLTCIWQVSGRNDVSFERWMKMDLAYIDSWSLGLDFKLMLKTVRAVIRGTGC